MPRAKPAPGTAIGDLKAERLRASVDADDDPALKPRQSIVSAATAPPTRTQAVASVFALGAAAKPPPPKPAAPLPDWDPEAVPIEAGVPIPDPRTGAPVGSKYRRLLARMEPGTRVVLPTKRAKALVAAAKVAKIPVVFRNVTADTAGVWKVEP